MPQLEPWSYPSQIFWLVVTFVALSFVLSKVVIPRITSVLEARQEKIEDDLARAERLKTEAGQVLEEYNRSLDEARSEAQSLVKDAQAAMAADAAERSQALANELAERNREAEARIAETQQAALANIRPAAAEVAAAALGKLIGSAPPAERIERAVEAAAGDRTA